jgi:lipopolysaccharide transport system ATP-binding protein
MNGSDIAIRVANLSKCYHIYDKPQDRLKQAVFPRLHRLAHPFRQSPPPHFYREFWALNDVSFEVRRGESMGIIGRNGAGKSTLLQLIAGTLTPTGGSVDVSGRVAALLELGSGFNPEFTGRENVYLNASLLGLSTEETEAKFDEIAAFADIGNFIDQPVKNYSSGMLMRVAFAVQTAVEPALLIVDEALAVGDAKFQKKCYDRMREFQQGGGTVLLVTHDTHAITQICSRGVILESGKVYEINESHHIAKSYHRLLFGADSAGRVNKSEVERASPGSTEKAAALPRSADRPNQAVGAAGSSRALRYGSREVEIVEIGIRSSDGALTNALEIHGSYSFYFRTRFNQSIDDNVSFGFSITNRQGIEIYATKGGLHDLFLPPGEAGVMTEARMDIRMPLVPGDYFLSAAVAPTTSAHSEEFFDYWFDALQFKVYGHHRAFTTSVLDLKATLSCDRLMEHSAQ